MLIGTLFGLGLAISMNQAIWTHNFLGPKDGLLSPYLATLVIVVVGSLLALVFPRIMGSASMLMGLGCVAGVIVALIRDIRLAPIMLLWALAFIAVQVAANGTLRRRQFVSR